MTKWHIDRGKKVTGGRVHLHRKKRRFERGSLPLLTEIGEEKRRIEEGRGGTKKVRVVKSKFVNVVDSKTNKIKKFEILDVVSNPSNPHYVRRRIITKGSVVKIDGGLVKITSRPSQDGVVNGIVVEEKSK